MGVEYLNSGVTGRDSQDVRARDGPWARFFESGLDAVDHLESSHRVVVRKGELFGDDARCVVQQQ
jgi:hypothetical protein